MQNKSSVSTNSAPKKSILINTSRVVSRPDRVEGREETEIAAQISIPHESGWGWVVVICSLASVLILDGVAFTFGSLLHDIAEDLSKSEALVALINSIAVSLYFLSGPMSSALINRFGFRACTMTGSIICSGSLFISYFSSNYTSLCVFYGAFAGFGFSLINLSSALVVGFYFEKLRAIALAISSTGSSIGIMIFFPMNSYLVQIAGWRLTTLFHSGLFAIIYFLGMAFRPLLSLSVMKTTDEATRTVTYLPTLSTVAITSRSKMEALAPTATERIFGAVSNANFPTAATVVEGDVLTTNEPGPSTGAPSKLTLTVNNPKGSISRRQLKQVQSTISAVSDKDNKNIEIAIKPQHQESQTHGCWGRLCHWENEPPARPLYRDDAFYQGKVEKLPEYQKSMLDTTSEARTGLEYRLAVSRAAAATDLREDHGVFTTAVRRILATMMDPNLLKRNSFLLLCCSAFFTYVGLLVPYVYVKNRNFLAGIESEHCTWFVSVIGLSNIFGRIFLGILAYKLDPVSIFSCCCILAGSATCLSNVSYTLLFQYLYCVIFGFCIASVGSLRSILLVSLYGLDKLTNATGMILLFQGMGSLVSTPLAGILKGTYGYDVAFIVAGTSIIIGGVVAIPVRFYCKKEIKKETLMNIQENKQ